MVGYIHSQESFGTVDGPGIRYVVFMQGCPLRCVYCHNPDTWEFNKNNPISPDEIIDSYLKNRSFYSKGGITVTGGEPLMQMDFLIDLFKKAKEHNIHTCIDTSGITFKNEKQYLQKLDMLLSFTDLVMLDIKHIDSYIHKEITGMDNSNILDFARYLDERKIPVWIRHIIIKGITDDPVFLEKLGKFTGSLSNVKAIDVLPYHTMGVAKYKKLGINYPLENVAPTDKEKALEAKKIILKGFYSVKK